jgi:hypothetical protein
MSEDLMDFRSLSDGAKSMMLDNMGNFLVIGGSDRKWNSSSDFCCTEV